MLTIVSLLGCGEHSVFVTPKPGTDKAVKADAIRRAFRAHEGDLNTLLRVHDAWRAAAAAAADPSGAPAAAAAPVDPADAAADDATDGGGGGAKPRRGGGRGAAALREWCAENFVSMRAMSRAALVRRQLATLLEVCGTVFSFFLLPSSSSWLHHASPRTHPFRRSPQSLGAHPLLSTTRYRAPVPSESGVLRVGSCMRARARSK